MNKRQYQIQQYYLNNEQAVLKELKHSYSKALAEIGEKIMILQAGNMTQAKIYQLQYQLSLQTQINQVLERLRSQNYKTLDEYLKDCYFNGFVGTLYDLQGQGVPLVFPMNQVEILKAIQLDSQIKVGMYQKLGFNIAVLKKSIADEIARGIANGYSYHDIARNLEFYSNVDYNKAKNIARTEGHRIREAATYDCQLKAKKRGANIKKQWDATLDGTTRSLHWKLDGQIAEVDEPYKIGNYSPMHPGDFGDPAQDCNCRCSSSQKAKWLLDVEETKMFGGTDGMSEKQIEQLANKLGITASELEKYKGNIIPLKAKNYEDFRRQYEKIWNADKVKVARV